MIIGFVLDDTLDKTDGVQQYVLTLGKWLSDAGHEVHYLVGESKQSSLDNVHSLSRNFLVGFNKNRLTIPFSVNKAHIRHTLQKHNFDVLHVQMPYNPMLAHYIIKNAGKQTAVVGTFHIVPFSSVEQRASKLLARVLRKSLRRFDDILSVSPPARDFALDSFGINSEVLPNVIDLKSYKAGKRLAKYDDGRFNIVFLGRLVKRKGAMELLQAINHLNKTSKLHNKTRVLIVGKGPLMKSLQNYCKKNKLDTIVEFCGFVAESDKPNYLASADLAVFPSLGGESFGIVLLEAMAAGAKVVIGGNNIGYQSVLGSEKSVLFDPSNTAGFARLLRTYINKSHDVSTVHGEQQAKVKIYDVNTVGPKLTAKYARAVAKRNKARHNKSKT